MKELNASLQLLKENEELRAEVETLKAQLKDVKREEIPEDVLDKHQKLNGILFKDKEDFLIGEPVKKYEINQTMSHAISFAVKSIIEKDNNNKPVSCVEMTKEQYKLYADTVDCLLSVLKHGIDAKKLGGLTSEEINREVICLGECIYDLTLLASEFMEKEKVHPVDSRDLYFSIHYWAEEFEKNLVENEVLDYYEAIEEYGNEKIKEYFEDTERDPIE